MAETRRRHLSPLGVEVAFLFTSCRCRNRLWASSVRRPECRRRPSRLVRINERAPPAAGDRGDLGVVLAYRLDVVAARDADLVLDAFELALECEEVLAGLDVGIALDDGQETAQGAAELSLCLLEVLHRIRIGENVRRHLHLSAGRLRSGFDHLGQHTLLLLSEAFDGRDEVRDEIGAGFVGIEDLRPRRLGVLLIGRDVVHAATGERQCDSEHTGQDKRPAGPGKRRDNHSAEGLQTN